MRIVGSPSATRWTSSVAHVHTTICLDAQAASHRPSGEYATADTGFAPWRSVASSWPDPTAQTRTAPSLPPDAIVFPSGA